MICTIIISRIFIRKGSVDRSSSSVLLVVLSVPPNGQEAYHRHRQIRCQQEGIFPSCTFSKHLLFEFQLQL